MTTDDLGDLAAVSPAVVSGWETGRFQPTPNLLARVATALHVTISDLVVLPAEKALLSDLRAQTGMTQAQVGRSLGLSTSAVARIEKGRKKFDPNLADSMAELYAVSDSQIRAAWDLTTATRAAHLRSF